MNTKRSSTREFHTAALPTFELLHREAVEREALLWQSRVEQNGQTRKDTAKKRQPGTYKG